MHAPFSHAPTPSLNKHANMYYLIRKTTQERNNGREIQHNIHSHLRKHTTLSPFWNTAQSRARQHTPVSLALEAEGGGS